MKNIKTWPIRIWDTFSVRRWKIVFLRTLVLCLGFTWNGAYADAMADCIRFSAVKAWQVNFTLQGDAADSPDPDTDATIHKTLIASSYILDNKIAPSSCPGNIQFQSTSPSATNVTAVFNYKHTVRGEPPCDEHFFWENSTSDPVIFEGPLPELDLQFLSGTYRLEFFATQPTLLSTKFCGTDGIIDLGKGAAPMAPIIDGHQKEFIDMIALPASGLVLKGQRQFTSEPTRPDMRGQENWTVTWNISPLDSDESKKKETIPRTCKQSGSIIGCENQSLGEVVGITGTAFRLHYQSDRATGRNLVNPVAIAHAQALGGWTLNVHHRYDPAINELYLGDGDHRDTSDLGTVKPKATGGFLIASEDASVVYEFAADGRHLKTLHGLTGAALLTFGYDSKARLIDIADGSGNHTTVQRDGNGRPTSIVGPYGQTTRLTVDANEYLASVTHPSGAVDMFTTTSTGLLSSYTNPRKKVSKFVYDGQGRLISDTNAASGVQTLTRSETAPAFDVTLRTAEGRTTQYHTTPGGSGGEARVITNAAGLKTETSRAADGTQTTVSPDGTQTTQVVEADPRFGQSAAVVKNSSITMPSGLKFVSNATRSATLADPANPFSLSALTDSVYVNGRTYSITYDNSSRSFLSKTPTGRTSQMTIDPLGRVVSQATPGLFPTAYIYDARGRLESVSQGDGVDARTVQFNYDSAGYLEGVTDPLGRSATFARDTMGRVTQQTLPDGRAIGYSYDSSGNLIAVTPPGRPAHGFTYSNVDQAATYVAPQIGSTTSTTKYAYNRDRQLISVSQPGGTKIALSYDAVGRAAAVKIKRGSFGFAYDPQTGHLNNITAPGGIGLAYAYDGNLVTASTLTGPVAGSVQRIYDNDFRVKELRVNNADALGFQFDQDGLLTNAGALTLIRDPKTSLLTGTTLGKVTDSFSYDGFGAVNTAMARFNAAEVLKTQYGYDKLGRITTRTETIAGTTDTFTYSYDPAGRLAEIKKNGVTDSTYAYDVNGNRLSRTAAGITVAGTYDNQDRLMRYGTATYAYTANGELKSKKAGTRKTGYAYDELGNLLSVSLPGGSKIEYLVDGSNRRIGKKLNGVLVQSFIYQDQLKPITELDGNNKVVSRFVYATHVNVPDYMVKGGVTYRIITDLLGSPRLVVDVATGTIAQRIDYDEFGQVRNDTNPGFQPFGFAGGLYDRDTKLVRFGARDYDAETGRWTAKDQIRFKGGDTNLYGYVLADPVNKRDLTGFGDWPVPFDNGVITNNTNRPIVVIDMDNNHAVVLGPGVTSDSTQDMDFIIDNGNLTKVGPNRVAVNQDGSVTQSGIDLFPGYNPGSATTEEIRDVLSRFEDQEQKICRFPTGNPGSDEIWLFLVRALRVSPMKY